MLSRNEGGVDPANVHRILSFLNDIRRLEVSQWGDPVDAVIIRTVYLGEMEGRLFDVTSLASVTCMTVPTAARRVSVLVDRNLLSRYRDGRSFRLATTAESRRMFGSAIADLAVRADGLAQELSAEGGFQGSGTALPQRRRTPVPATPN